MGAVPASATTVNLAWTDGDNTQTGFALDRATDPNFLDNLVTQNLPATPSSFTDSLTGLAPGETFYYRIRAVNLAGDSTDSNTATVTIPLAPAKPTDAQVVNVTSSEITLSWTDNAGTTATGYLILRSVNNGPFTTYTTLPGLNATPPSTYTWTDTNVLPDTLYNYHIIAYNVSGYNDFAGVNVTTPGQASGGIQWVQDASLGYATIPQTSQAAGAFFEDPTIGNYIVVWVWAWGAGGWSSSDITCSDNLTAHNTYTQAGFVKNGAAAFCFFYAKVANTGPDYTPTITVNSVSSPSISVIASEFSGIEPSNPIDGTAVTAVGTGTPASLGKMNVKANDLVLAGLSWNEDSAVSITKPSGWTQSGNGLDDASIDPDQYTEYGDAIYSINPTSPTAPSWTVSGGTSSTTDAWCASQLAFLSNNPPLAISPSSLPAGTVGQAYSQTFTTTGGTGSVTLSESGIPTWLTFTASTGTLSGTPTASDTGTFSFSVTATDSAGDTTTRPTPLSSTQPPL